MRLSILGALLLISFIITLSRADDQKVGLPYFAYDLQKIKDDREFRTVKKSDNSLHVISNAVVFPRKNIGYLGRGYDAYYGNPKETSLGGDGGYRRPVFLLDHSEDTYDADWRHLQAKKVDITTRVSCDGSTRKRSITSLSDLFEDVGDSFGFTSGGGPDKEVNAGIFSAAFANRNAAASTTAFTNMKKDLKETENGFVSIQSTCSVYEATINLYQPPAFDPIFQSALNQLPKEYNDDAVDIYDRFIREYGTHVTKSILMGSRFGKYLTMSKNRVEDATGRTDHESSKSEYAKGGGAFAFGFGAKSMTKVNNEREMNSAESKANKLTEEATDEKVYSVGAPYHPDPVEWAKASATDPFPVRITLMSLPEIVAIYDKQVAKNVKTALEKYHPPGVENVEGAEFEKCYLEKTEHTIMQAHIKKTSLIARCKPGYTAYGGAFVHLWNVNGDVEVDELATSAENIMKDLKLFHNLDAQERSVEFILEQGAGMLQKFTQARGMDDLKEIFGDSIDPSLTHKFLEGTLRSLGLKKNKVLGGLVNGLQVFGQSKLGSMAKDFLKQNPYASSIMEVSGKMIGALSAPLHGDRTEAISLSIDSVGATSETQKKVAEEHIRTLIHVLNAVDQHRGHEIIHEEESKPLIFEHIKNIVSTAVSAFDSFLKEHGDKPFVTAALSQWKKFSSDLNDIWKDYSKEIRQHETKIKSTNMFQDIVTKITEEHISTTTLLAQRNSLNFLFPFEDNAFVCGGGSLGLTPTAKSALGYCSAYCCKSPDWKTAVTSNRKGNVDMVKKTAEITAVCPSGYTVVSGGVVLGDYQEGRYIQVVASHAESDHGWKCRIRWSEEDFIPFAPRYKCVAKCAIAKTTTVECTNKAVPLVNGHGTVHCASNEMALSGGWDIQSNGITYFKKTEFRDISDVDGARSYRCEFGTTHGKVIGNCMARCCSAFATDLENYVINEVHSSETCKPDWETRTVPAPYHMSLLGMHTEPYYRPIGNIMRVNDIIDTRMVLVSKNMKFYSTFHTWLPRIEVYEQYDCEGHHLIGTVDMKLNSWDCAIKMLQNGGGFARLRGNGLIATHGGDDICSTWDVAAHTVQYLTLKDNGDLVFYDVDDNAAYTQAFSDNRLFYKKHGLESPVMEAGETLTLGRGLVSKNKKYSFIFMEGGKFAIGFQERDGHIGGAYKVLWTDAKLDNGQKITDEHTMSHFNTQFKKEGWALILQEDNNLVVFDDNKKEVWASGTHGMGQGQARLEITDEGSLELRDAVGVLLWTLRGGVLHSCVPLRERLKIRSHRLGMSSILLPGIGGLVSKNRQYVMFIESRDGGSHLELWREGGADCKPVRLSTLMENVRKLELTHNAVVVNDNNAVAKFNSVPLFDMVLDDAGHLTVYGGKNHRREEEIELFKRAPYVAPDQTDANGRLQLTETMVTWRGKIGIPQQSWSKCPDKAFLRGWKQIGTKRLTDIETAICGTYNSDVECTTADWWGSFDDKGWSVCPNGYVISGVLTTNNQLFNLESATCCKLKGRAYRNDDCYEDTNKKAQMTKAGSYVCDKPGYFVAGFERQATGCNDLTCIEKWRCCRMD